MKLLWCNGKTLEVRDVGPVIFRLEAETVPLVPAGGYRLLGEDEAREQLRALLKTGLYGRSNI